MSLNIKNEETHRRARELARLAGETMTEAVDRAVAAGTVGEHPQEAEQGGSGGKTSGDRPRMRRITRDGQAAARRHALRQARASEMIVVDASALRGRGPAVGFGGNACRNRNRYAEPSRTQGGAEGQCADSGGGIPSGKRDAATCAARPGEGHGPAPPVQRA
ncbi:MAG: type II toxin-antitoxin system VapB family antitoxin [Acidobacteria bacterium]|nr:type II toxin-antitoxin system VapB family antitoxin [Acidobacteriota bacterium]